MSEMLQAEDMNSVAAPAGGAGTTAGTLLREARQAAGVHVAALAVALKVPVQKLEALEADRYDVFTDVVFLRALASSVCRTLKVDAAPVLALLPMGAAPRLSVDHGINASFKDGSARVSGSGGSAVSRSVIAVVLVLLLGALAMVFVPRGLERQSSSADKAAVASAPAAPAATEPAEAAPSAPAASSAVVSAAQPQQPSAPAAIAAAPAPAPAPATPAPATPATATAVPAPAAAAAVAAPAAAALPGAEPVAAGDVLVITASAPSWVQVRSLSGGGTTQKMLAAGDRLVAAGSPPWAVVVGKADATTVTVRGKPMDLVSIARENVARFEVK